MTKPELIFVYNADSGLRSALFDAAHKLISPATYPCSLCAITYGAVAMRREWRDALATLALPQRFLHRDEFAREWPGLSVELPAILIHRDDGPPRLLIDRATLDRQRDVADLAATLRKAIGRAT